jgi:hypothetical protein
MRFPLLTELRVSDDFSRAVTTAFGKAENFGDRVAKKVGGTLQKAFSKDSLKKVLASGAVVAGAAAAGAIALGSGLNEVADGLARVGRAGKEQQIDPQFLAALQQKAAQKGIEDTDEVLRATEEFLLRLQELRAKDPSGELFSGLTDIGRKDLVKEFKKAKDPLDALMLAMSTIALEKDAAKRVKLADAIFGGSDAGLDLRRVFEDAAALEDLVANQRELAGATKEQFEAAVRLSDAKSALRAQLRSLTVQMAASLVPAFEQGAQRMTGWVAANRELLQQKLGEFVAWVSQGIEALLALDWQSWLQGAVEWLSSAASSTGEFLSAVVRFGTAAVKWGSKVMEVARSLGLDAEGLIRIGTAFFAMWAATKLVRMGKAVMEVASAIKAAGGAMGVMGGAAKRAGAAVTSALSFTGPAGAVLALVAALDQLVKRLEEAERISKRQVDFDFRGQADIAASDELQLKRRLQFLERAQFGLRMGSRPFGPQVPEAEGLLRDFGGDPRAAQAAVAEQMAAVQQELRAVQARLATAQELGRLTSEPARTVEEARRREALSLLRTGDKESPLVQELLKSLPDREFAERAVQLDNEIARKEAEIARLEARREEQLAGGVSGTAGQGRSTPIQIEESPSLRQFANEMTRQARAVTELVASQRSRADVGRR